MIIVSCMVLASGLMRFWQEHRSAKAAEALKAMVRTTASVLRREGPGRRAELREIPMGELVVGDIVRLSAGDMIPADIRLIESRDLFISQAVLTGEALPVE
ncbi:Magnesium-transporting ATPase, P-type 1 [compost metagenome]